uniref:uncharacterized protein isoform X2 n=1 Tax=Centroberyx gerrardi TaxID=166262 RepID=UPI003AAC741A
MMKLLLSSLLLASLSAPSSWSVLSENKFVVTQSPDVTIKEGETVQIDCCWNMDITKGRVNWLKNQTNIKETIFTAVINNNGQHQGSLKKEECNCSNLTFSNIMRNDSGRYICEVFVEIPQLNEAQGKGAVITVTARHNTTNQPTKGPDWQEVLISVLRYLPFLTLLLTFFYLNRRGIKPQQHKPAAPTNEPTSAQRGDEGEEEGGVRGIEDDAVDASCLVEEAPTQEVHNSEQEGERK